MKKEIICPKCGDQVMQALSAELSMPYRVETAMGGFNVVPDIGLPFLGYECPGVET